MPSAHANESVHAHALARHFCGLLPNGSRPGSGPRPGDFFPNVFSIQIDMYRETVRNINFVTYLFITEAKAK